ESAEESLALERSAYHLTFAISMGCFCGAVWERESGLPKDAIRTTKAAIKAERFMFRSMVIHPHPKCRVPHS
ncbi:MAG TPA: hypothetical protein VGU23_06365, partial [Acidobacteriaceae bacterium]|nr:hypothetical protein [Acidobacteriaceae bacterium]